MKRRSFYNQSVSLALIASYLGALASPIPAFAVINAQTNGLAVDANKVKVATPSCDDFCSTIVNSDGSTRGLSGDSWAAGDDQWCADHGSPTESAVGPSKNKPAAAPADSCNVPMFQSENCRDVNKKLLQCKWKNSQAGTQCMAYLQSDSVGASEYVVLGLDLAATATCGVECAMMGGAGGVPVDGAGGGINKVPVLNPADKVNNTGGGGLPLKPLIPTKWDRVQLNQEKYLSEPTFKLVQFLINLIPNACAAGADMLSNSNLATACGIAGGAASAGQLVAIIQAKDSAVSRIMQGLMSVGAGAATYGAASKDALSDQGEWSNKRKSACAAAGLFAVLAGLRYFNINKIDKTKEDACKAVQQLASGSGVMSTGGQPDINNTNTVAGNGTSNTNASGGSSAGGVGGFGLGGQVAQGLQCIQANGMTGCNNGLGAQATDGGMLTNSGLDRVLAPMAQKLDFNGLKKQMGSGASAGSMMAGALGGSVPGDLGRSLAQLAEASHNSAADFAGSAGMGSGTSFASSGGGGGRSPASSDGGLGAFGAGFGSFGNEKAGALGGGNNLANFAQAAPDIWHSNSGMSIFEIISTKIEKVTNRVGNSQEVR